MIELVVGGLRQPVARHVETQVRQRLGGIAIGDALEPRDQHSSLAGRAASISKRRAPSSVSSGP